MDEDDNKDFFGNILAVPEEEKTKLAPQVEVVDNADLDYATARDAIVDVVETATKALEKAARLADQLQEPKAYASLASMINSTTAAAKSLVELNKTRNEAKKEEAPVGPQVVHNTIVMTTSEMQREIAKMIENQSAK